jgi:hypothetical protein
VTDSTKPARESIVVECLTCHERIGVGLKDAPHVIRCTFCDAEVKVPSRQQVKEAYEAQKGPVHPTTEAYAIAQADRAPNTEPAGVGSKRKTAAKSRNEQMIITVECAVCHELNSATPGPKAGRIACSFCQSVIHVPDLKSVASRKARPIATRAPSEIGDYKPGPAPETLPPRPGNVFDRLGEVRQEVLPTPPRWTFFSGVFTLLFRPETAIRWAFMSIGFCLVQGLLFIVPLLIGGGMVAGLIAPFFALPIIWLTFFTCSYTSACSLFVFESTAAGLDQIEAWPESNWRDWMSTFFYVGWIAVIPLSIACGICQLAGLPLEVWVPTAAAIFFAVFPVSFLSAMEANSVWVPLTLPILGSLFRWLGSWLTFYAVSALIVGLPLLGFLKLIESGYIFVLLLFGPVWPAVTLIYFRLLGRLAWKITASEKRGRKRPAPTSIPTGD